jgi:hypothetical protein
MKRALLLIVVLLAGLVSGCVKKIDGETPEQLKARKRAIYSAQVVTSISGMSDLTEILVDSQVLDPSSGFKLVEINDRALSAVDTLRERLKAGFDAGAIATVRNVLTDIEKARKAGGISFKSQKAADFYFEAIASTEVTLNLIEALQAGRREPSIRAAGDRALQRLQAGADEPKWWNRAIVKATEIARIMAAQGALDTPTAWADGDERSAILHAKNKVLLETWKSTGNLQ